MRWVRIGERIHAVARKHGGKTLCGLEVGRATKIEHDGNFDERCGNCDKRWRDIGRAQKPASASVKKADGRTVYKPRYGFEDFDRGDT